MSLGKVQAILSQGLTHHQAGRYAEALALYAQIRRLLPSHFEAHHLAGVATLQSGKPAQAIPLLTRATQLKAGVGTTYMCLGLAYGQVGQSAPAEAALRRAVTLEPGNHEAWYNLASTLLHLGKLAEAESIFKKCTELKPDSAEAWSGLGLCCQLFGRGHEAIAHQTRALELNPGHRKALCFRAQARQSCHQVAEALLDFEAQLAAHPEDIEARSYRLFLLNYSEAISPAALFAEHVAFGKAVEGQAPLKSAVTTPLHFKPHAPPARLRVAFLSPDLRAHSVAHFLEPLLQHLDRSQFEVVLYHDHFLTDATSERLKKHAVLWRNFIGQPGTVVERQIRDDAPYVVVDLAGHTGFNRLELFARRLAPVQITYLGYPNTTGLRNMDFRFTDAVADPAASEAYCTEKLVRFSSVAWAYAPAPDAPPVQPPPSQGGRPFTFGSFNNFSKIGTATLRLWADVLRNVPGSRLLLKSFAAEQSAVRRRLLGAGIPSERTILLPGTATTRDHLIAYDQVDVALDTVPYNGTTTTCEALWMGAPVVTLRGDRHASRVSASLLTAIGHAEWIAEDAAGYVEVARALAADGPRLATLRDGLRQDILRSPLLDHAGQAERFGRAILECCGRLAPATQASLPPV